MTPVNLFLTLLSIRCNIIVVKIMSFVITFIPASSFLDQNILVLITGANKQTPACALSTVTGIPLIRLHGNRRSLEHCKKSVQFSPGYRDYGHAFLDILNSFGWKTIALVFDGKDFILPTQQVLSLLILHITHPFRLFFFH